MAEARSVVTRKALKKQELLQYNAWAKGDPSRLEDKVPLHEMYFRATGAQECDGP